MCLQIILSSSTNILHYYYQTTKGVKQLRYCYCNNHYFIEREIEQLYNN